MRTPDQIEAEIFNDLCKHAREQVRGVALRIAQVAPREMAAGILMDAAQDLTVVGAVSFLASTPGGAGIDAAAGLRDPKICEVFVAICNAWALAPDQAAAEKVLLEALGRLSGAKMRLEPIR